MLLALLLFTVVLAQSPGTFFNPPAAVNSQPGFESNPIWTAGDTQLIQWTTTFSNYTIGLWQQVLGQGIALEGPSIFQTQAGAVTQFGWVVQTFQFDLNSSNVFYLWLLQGTNSDTSKPSVTSHYFSISAAASSSISSSSSTSSSITIMLSPTLSSSRTSIAPLATSTSTDSNHSSSLTTGAKVGVGLGAVIGVSVVAAVVALTMWRLRRRRRSQSSLQQVQEAQMTKSPETVQLESLPQNIHPVEVEGARHPAELS